MQLRIIAASAMILFATAAFADEMENVAPVTHAATKKECGECHMAFQPGLLPAQSWSRIMGGLTDHFGENASLPDEIAADINIYLTSNAGRGDGRLLRITEQRWWLHEHKLRAEVWTRPKVRSKANCEACHIDAAKGIYEDD